MPKKLKPTSPERMKEACKAVLIDKVSKCKTCRTYKLSKRTLNRYLDKCKNIGFTNMQLSDFKPNYDVRKIFTDEEEKVLGDYLILSAKYHYGFTYKYTRELAYELATNQKTIPESWVKHKSAGRKWMGSFMQRNRNLTLRTPEATSLARCMGFNRPVVKKFYENLREVLDKYNFAPEQIYNMDESALTTVPDVSKVIAQTGSRQVGQVTSAERGVLVTLIAAVNAIGNSIPPLLVFPRKRYKEYMGHGTPIGSLCLANSSGWSNSEIFCTWLSHFQNHAKCTKSNPALLIMDNHATHITIASIEFAKENGIVLLTLPPHCSHKLQPLDVSIFGPLKIYYNAECSNWLVNKPGRRVSIYEVGEMLGKSYSKAFTQSNIVAGFRKSGIYPFDDNVFTDDEFLPAVVTDQPQEGSITGSPTPLPIIDTQLQLSEFSPEDVRPFPKAHRSGPVKSNRKRGRTLILTNTPVKDTLFAELTSKKAKNSKSRKRTPIIEDSYSSDEDTAMVLDDSTDFEEDFCEMIMDDIKEGDHVLVKITTERPQPVTHYYVGLVLEDDIEENEFEIKFMKRVATKNPEQLIFVYPEVDDIAGVDKQDIVKRLPTPFSLGTSSRACNQYKFDYDFSDYHISTA